MKSVFDLVQRYHALYSWSRETQEEVKREGKGGQGPSEMSSESTGLFMLAESFSKIMFSNLLRISWNRKGTSL
jgi:type III secretory pathway component EscU